MIKIPAIGEITRIKQGLDLDTSPLDKLLAQAHDFYAGVVGPTLVKNYPGVQWKVTIRIQRSGAIAYIQIPKISLKFGMVVHIPESVPLLEQEVMLAGGELLERFNVSRQDKTEEDLAALPTDIFGQVKGSDKGELPS